MQSTVEPERETGGRLSGHMSALDGIRGIAILTVLVHHTLHLENVEGPIQGALSVIARSGWIGVDLFFTLSGFLITGILLRSRDRPHYFRNFYARRTLRIFPLYFVFLAVAVHLFPLLLPAREGWGEDLANNQVFYWSYTVNVGTCFVFDEWPPYGMGHLWSLCIEEHFYLIWPVLIFYAKPGVISRCCVAIAVIGPISRLICVFVASQTEWEMAGGQSRLLVANYTFTLLRLDAIAIGALARILLESRGTIRQVIPRWLTKLSLVGIAGLVLVETPGLAWVSPLMQSIGYTCLAICFADVIASSALGRVPVRLNKVLTSRALTFFGKYSYAVYVFHMPVDVILHEFVRQESLAVLQQVPSLARSLLFMVVSSGLSVILALASWVLLERHFLRLKKFF